VNDKEELPPASVWTLQEPLVQPGETTSHSVAFGDHRGTSIHGFSLSLARETGHASPQVDQAGRGGWARRGVD
jgi:hypothetical protein